MASISLPRNGRIKKNSDDGVGGIFYTKGRGYVVYDIVDGRNRPYDNALAHRYLVFAKESGRFRTTHQW